MSVTFTSNKAAVLAQMEKNMIAALYAMGEVTAGFIIMKMNSYPNVIWLTGDLQRDVHYEVDTSKEVVRVGNSLSYAIFVHEGNSRMAARAYIKEGTFENIKGIKELAVEPLKRGFE